VFMTEAAEPRNNNRQEINTTSRSCICPEATQPEAHGCYRASPDHSRNLALLLPPRKLRVRRLLVSHAVYRAPMACHNVIGARGLTLDLTRANLASAAGGPRESPRLILAGVLGVCLGTGASEVAIVSVHGCGAFESRAGSGGDSGEDDQSSILGARLTRVDGGDRAGGSPPRCNPALQGRQPASPWHPCQRRGSRPDSRSGTNR